MRKFIISPMLGQGLDFSFNAFVDLVKKYGSREHIEAYSLVSAAYLWDEFFSYEVNALGFTKRPGTIANYKIGKLSDVEFISALKEKLPDLQKASDQEIIDAWAAMSVPRVEISENYCNAIKQGYSFIFVSYTNRIQTEKFKAGLEANCPEFIASDHHYALSFLSPNSHINAEDLTKEYLEANNLYNEKLTSCHLEIDSLEKAIDFQFIQQDLAGCLVRLSTEVTQD